VGRGSGIDSGAMLGGSQRISAELNFPFQREPKDEFLDGWSATRKLSRYLTFSLGDIEKFIGL
jgi:hypothetical protein